MGGDAGRARRIQTHIEGERDAIGTEVLEPGSHLIRLDQRGAADHDPGDAEVEHLRNRGGIAQTSAHLQFDAGLGGEFGDDRAIAGASVARAVEIDHVQPIGAVDPDTWRAARAARCRSCVTAAKSPCSSLTQ